MTVKSARIGWHIMGSFVQNKDRNTRGNHCLLSQIRLSQLDLYTSPKAHAKQTVNMNMFWRLTDSL